MTVQSLNKCWMKTVTVRNKKKTTKIACMYNYLKYFLIIIEITHYKLYLIQDLICLKCNGIKFNIFKLITENKKYIISQFLTLMIDIWLINQSSNLLLFNYYHSIMIGHTFLWYSTRSFKVLCTFGSPMMINFLLGNWSII